MLSVLSVLATVEPLIVDPPRKRHCMLDLYTWVIALGPKYTFPIASIATMLTYQKRTTYLQGTNHTAEYCLQLKSPLISGSTVYLKKNHPYMIV